MDCQHQTILRDNDKNIFLQMRIRHQSEIANLVGLLWDIELHFMTPFIVQRDYDLSFHSIHS